MPWPEDAAGVVGRNVRALRQQRRLGVDELAAAAGIDPAALLQVETERCAPSLAVLVGLASALGVGVDALVDGHSAPRVVVRRDAEAPRLWTTTAGSTAVLRVGGDPPDGVELWEWTLQPGDAFDGPPHPVGSQQLLSVLSGRLGLRIGSGTRWLDGGDSARFPAHVPHRCRAGDEVPARFVVVLLRPGSGGSGSRSGRVPVPAEEPPPGPGG